MSTTPILIDLDNLTWEMVEEALPHMGTGQYTAPCIIGVLLTVEDRERLDDTAPVRDLISAQRLAFPTPEQATEAPKLQRLFDSGDRKAFLSHPRIAGLMVESVPA
jgi:hypothetical protein